MLGLFEGVCSGAADGYYRMTDKPASTLLHLGPGLANAAANLHNAKKAGSGVVNIVGEHALYSHQIRHAAHRRHRGHRASFSHWGEDLADLQDGGGATARWRSKPPTWRRARSRR